MVVQEQTQADHPSRTQLRHVRHHEAHRRGEVRRDAEQDLALRQRLGHESELE
jgi:hypothetical protein